MKRKPPPPEGAPLWMCTFGDLMSLLLCFFIMLFAISIISEVKWEALVEALNRQMGYAGVSSVPSPAQNPSAPPAGIPDEGRRTAALHGNQPTPGKGGDFKSGQTIDPDGAPVRGGLLLFELGDATLTDKAKEDLELIFPTLSNAAEKIMIKGHVGPDELRFGFYEREIFLAYDRAIAVRDHLVAKGLSDTYFNISVADSSTAPNRTVLPPGMEARQAGASAAVYLISETLRD